MKPYLPPRLTQYANISAITADSRDDDSSDIFFSLNGPQPGLGGDSGDTYVTRDGVTCI